jgi:hypothetical protein
MLVIMTSEQQAKTEQYLNAIKSFVTTSRVSSHSWLMNTDKVSGRLSNDSESMQVVVGENVGTITDHLVYRHYSHPESFGVM